MSSNVKESFIGGTSPTSLTVTGLSTLSNATSATSNTVDNSTNLALDYVINVSLTSAGSGTSATGYCEVYLQGSNDGTFFPDVTNDILLEVISMTVNATGYKRAFTVAKGLQGFVPNSFRLRFNNVTGGAFTAATVTYSPAFITVG